MNTILDSEIVRLLPVQAQALIKNLEGQYPSVPVPAAIGGIIATLYASVGPFSLDYGIGHMPAPSFKIFVVSEDHSVSTAIGLVAEPLLAFQRSSFAACRLLDLGEIHRRIAVAKREYTDWLLRERVTDPDYDAAFRKRILELMSRLPKVVIESSPEPDGIASMLQRSADEAVLLLGLDSSRTHRFVSTWTRDNQADLGVFDASGNGVPSLTPAGILVNPRLDALFVGHRFSLRAVAESEAMRRNFWVIATKPKNEITAASEQNWNSEWPKFVKRLLQARYAFGSQHLRFDTEAWKLVVESGKEHTSQGIFEGSTCMIGDGVAALAGIAGLLHLIADNATSPISRGKVGNAVTIWLWLREQARLALNAKWESPLDGFIRAKITPSGGSVLTLKTLKRSFEAYRDGNEFVMIPPASRDELAAGMKRVWGAKMRKDLKPPIIDTRGWKGYAYEAGRG